MGRFTGNLLHGMFQSQLVPDILVATGVDYDMVYPIEIFPSAFLSICKGKLPVLKAVSLQINIELGQTISIANNGFITVDAILFNLDENQVPTTPLDGDTYFEVVCHGDFSLWDSDNDTTIERINVWDSMIRNFGENGVILRPEMAVYVMLKNSAGDNISANSIRVTVELDVDWVDVTDAEFTEYTKELWLLGAVID